MGMLHPKPWGWHTVGEAKVLVAACDRVEMLIDRDSYIWIDPICCRVSKKIATHALSGIDNEEKYLFSYDGTTLRLGGLSQYGT